MKGGWWRAFRMDCRVAITGLRCIFSDFLTHAGDCAACFGAHTVKLCVICYVGHSSGLGFRDPPFAESVKVGPPTPAAEAQVAWPPFCWKRVHTWDPTPRSKREAPCARHSGHWSIPKGARCVSHLRRQVPRRPWATLGIPGVPGCLWAVAPLGTFLGKVQRVLVSFSFTEAFSFNDDILVKLL